MDKTTTTENISLNDLLLSASLTTETSDYLPMISDDLSTVNEKVSDEERLISSVAALLVNLDEDEQNNGFNKCMIQGLIHRVDSIINDQVNEVLHAPEFQRLESTWCSIDDLIKNTNFRANIKIDLFDADKEEIAEDFECNSSDMTGSALFKKVYTEEYDQYGGEPYGSIIGLYEFKHTPKDIEWLKNMSKLAAASHSPFTASVGPQFFGCNTAEELSNIKDLEGLMKHPKYGGWNAFRETDEAAYIALTLPRYMVRLPYDPVNNPAGNILRSFKEDTSGHDNKGYLWGNASMLFARNLVRAFENTGWCQSIRGPKGGGEISGLPVHTFNTRGQEEIKIPVEFAIPDYRELEFANSGFMPLIYQKGSANACFFSTQSLRAPEEFVDPKDSENAKLVTNLAYTMSVTRIAHYVKRMMRDNIGSSAEQNYIQKQMTSWVTNYVSEITNPDDITIGRFPFKKADVSVTPTPGEPGWFHCIALNE